MLQVTVNRRHLMVFVAVVALVVVGWMAVASRASAATSVFDDVADDNAFVSDINWLADAGVTKGCNPPSNTKYCPSAFVTREQMAAFMHRFAGVVETGDGGTGTDPAVLARLDALETKVGTLEAENAALKATLSGVTRNGDTLLLSGMNLQVVNGTGLTEHKNTLGNVIIGYNKWAQTGTPFRGGSHYLVVGDSHQYRSSGGIVAGYNNTASGDSSSVLGGAANIATGTGSTVLGGTGNIASGYIASVSGGTNNTASGIYSLVSGGEENTASGQWSSILGGYSHEVTTKWGFFPN
jgi:hypothetical protein